MSSTTTHFYDHDGLALAAAHFRGDRAPFPFQLVAEDPGSGTTVYVVGSLARLRELLATWSVLLEATITDPTAIDPHDPRNAVRHEATWPAPSAPAAPAEPVEVPGAGEAA